MLCVPRWPRVKMTQMDCERTVGRRSCNETHCPALQLALVNWYWCVSRCELLGFPAGEWLPRGFRGRNQ
jgi:hypothetical protein